MVVIADHAPCSASTTHPLLRWVVSSGAIHPGHGSYHRLMAADQDPNLPSASRPTRPAGLVPNASVAAVAAYAGIRTRVGDLVRDLAPGVADETGVPACPEWTVTETLAHLVGVTVDIVEGNIAEAGTKPWADAQAARFSSLGVDGLLDRWAETAPVIDSLGGVLPDMVASQLVFDAVTHEHDICGALGLPGARTSDAVEVGVGFLLAALAGSVAGGSAPSLVISLEGDEDVIVAMSPPRCVSPPPGSRCCVPSAAGDRSTRFVPSTGAVTRRRTSACSSSAPSAPRRNPSWSSRLTGFGRLGAGGRGHAAGAGQGVRSNSSRGGGQRA